MPSATPKKVLLIIIDALATRVVEAAVNDGRLPNFARLVKRGRFEPRCWSIFPSITPAATATLHTGGYPRDHGVAGAFWYDEKNDKIAYFGDDVWVIIREGAGKYFHDFQVVLNYEYLRTDTVYEIAAEHGKSTACVNSMWFKGPKPHKVHLPLLLKLIPGVKSVPDLMGPDILCLADFVTTTPEGSKQALSAQGGINRRYGFHDDTTGDYLLDLAGRGPLPDLTVAYFPNNDFESHERGPLAAVDTLQKVDATLGELFEMYGGVDAFLKTTAVLITGDHSQSDTLDDREQREIDLDEVLRDFNVVPAGATWSEGDQVMACPNMRSAQVYLRGERKQLHVPLVDALLAEPKIDQVFWAEPDASHPKQFVVKTADRGQLTFRHGAAGPNTAYDIFGTEWSWEGDLATVDGTCRGGKLNFGDYPNAFERIAAAFYDEVGHVWVTARVGHEFRLPKTETHPGGSHGSLHALDSTSPLIHSGVPEDVEVPSPSRTIDFVPLALNILGITPRFAPGAGRPPADE